MLRFVRKYYLYFLPSLICWLVLLTIQLQQSLFDLNKGKYFLFIPQYVNQILLIAFYILSLELANFIVKKENKLSTVEVLWQITAFGGTGILISVFFHCIQHIYIANYSSLFWQILDKNIGLLVAGYFFIALTFVFRQLIFFRTTKRKIRAWNFFYLIIVLHLLFFVSFYDSPWINALKIILFIMSLLFIFYMVFHIEWGAYLKVQEKLVSIVLLVVLCIVIITYSSFINNKYFNNFDHYWEFQFPLLPIYMFAFLYSIFSILVLGFSLPTSSIYELRELENKAIYAINRSILKDKLNYDSHQHKHQVFQILLDNSMKCSSAKSGFIKFYKNNQVQWVLTNIKETVAQLMCDTINRYWKFQSNKKEFFVGDLNRLSLLKVKNIQEITNGIEYLSLFAIHIQTESQKYGQLVLLWDYRNALEIEIKSVILMLCEQAAIAIENRGLFENSIELARSQQKLKIAKDFQDTILSACPNVNSFDIHVSIQEADVLGGDYYEILETESTIYVVIADVSGKGISSAFYMAELKGCLQPMFALSLSPHEFIINLNHAITRCLPPNHFITMNLLMIDKKTMEANFIRAGHPPLLFYEAASKQTHILQPLGIGLNLIKKGLFKERFHLHSFHLNKGDTLLFYTDGISEVRNDKNEELGNELLAEWFGIFSELSAAEINYSIMEQIMAFSNQQKINDDYTLLTMKVL